LREFLGDFSVQSDECPFTFPGNPGSGMNDVDDEIDIVTKRIEFLQVTVNSPFHNTPTVIINRTGRCQDKASEEKENIPLPENRGNIYSSKTTSI
jgi:hypothetical protein